MPTATVPGFIYDGYGRQAHWSGSGGTLHARTSEDDRLRPRPANHFSDYLALMAPWKYRELVSETRAIASRGLTRALLINRASYVSASNYAPQFYGSDDKYGETVLAALGDALKICNVRGGNYDWRATWRLSGPTRATDGSFFILLTSWGDTGWPALQVLEGHRIGQRDSGAGTVGATDAWTTIVAEDGSSTRRKGAYAGLKIFNGIIYNAVGTEVAYRVLAATPEEDEDISARDLVHVSRPQHFSGGRPAPELAAAVLDLAALDLAQTCQLDQQIIDAKLTLIETNASGKYDPSQAFATSRPPGATPAGTPTTIEERATTRYVKTGNDVKAYESDRPSDQWMNFDWRVGQRAAACLPWRIEMLDPSKLGGGATRAFQDQINTAIHDEYCVDAPAAARVLGYFVAKLAALKVVPQHAEWNKFGIAAPPWFEVDRASSKIDLEDVAAGRVPMSVLHARDGRTTAEVYNMRANAYELALEVQKKHPNVPLNIILGDLGLTAQRTGKFDNASGPESAISPDDESRKQPMNV